MDILTSYASYIAVCHKLQENGDNVKHDLKIVVHVNTKDISISTVTVPVQ